MGSKLVLAMRIFFIYAWILKKSHIWQFFGHVWVKYNIFWPWFLIPQTQIAYLIWPLSCDIWYPGTLCFFKNITYVGSREEGEICGKCAWKKSSSYASTYIRICAWSTYFRIIRNRMANTSSHWQESRKNPEKKYFFLSWAGELYFHFSFSQFYSEIWSNTNSNFKQPYFGNETRFLRSAGAKISVWSKAFTYSFMRVA